MTERRQFLTKGTGVASTSNMQMEIGPDAPSDPEANKTVWVDTNAGLFKYWDGTSWISVPGGSGGGTFSSDAHIWGDFDYELGGNVPNDYANYQLLRTVGSHINLHDDCSFTVSATTTVIYAHITFNNKTDQPSFLSDDGWSDTGFSGTCTLEDRDGANKTANIYYFSKSITGTYSWDYRTASIQNQLKYFPGVFLFESGITVSSIFPALYKIVSDISATYSALDGDWWWDPAPSSVGAADVTSTDWADLHTDVEAASAGDIIEITAANYNDDGEIVIDNVSGTAASPITIDLSNVTLIRGSTAIRLNNCDYIRIWGGVQGEGTGNSSFTRFTIDDDCTWCSIENFDFAAGSQDNNDDAITSVELRGKYNRVSNCEWDGRTSRGNDINFIPDDTDDTLSQFNLIQYCDFNNFNVGDLITTGQNAAYIRMGGNNNFTARGYNYIRRNRFQDWNETPDDSEATVIKSCGHIMSQNVAIANTNAGRADAYYTTRTGSWTYCWGNYHDCQLSNDNCGGFNFQGNDDTEAAIFLSTDLITARHYVQDCSSVPAYFQANQQDSTDTNRWIANNGLLCEVYAPDATDQLWRFNSDSNPLDPTNLHVHGCAFETTTNLDIDNYSALADTDVVTWLGNVADIAGYDGTDPGSGIDDTWTANFSDRGDGVLVTDDAVDSLGYDPCVPGQLTGPTIANLGLQ